MIDSSDLLHPLCPKCQIHEGMRNNPATAEWTCGGCHITWNSDYLMGWNHGRKAVNLVSDDDAWTRFVAELKAKRTKIEALAIEKRGIEGQAVMALAAILGGVEKCAERAQQKGAV